MKLLFDENLSFKLPDRLSDLYPHSLHVRDVDMQATIDPVVWDYAKNNDFIIVSKDADMHDMSLALGNLPKVVWLRLGNCSTRQVESLLHVKSSLLSSSFMKIRAYRCWHCHDSSMSLDAVSLELIILCSRLSRMSDRIHQPYHKKLIPGYDDVRRAAMRAGAWGLVISSAGPTLLALSPSDTADGVCEAMEVA